MDVTIRELVSQREYRACEALQREAWSFATDLDVIPLTQLVATQKAGGILLGAFDADERLRAFCYGFLGRDDDGRLLHYSHMLAVDRAARSAGLGATMKWAQRRAAIEQGLELMVWTYDPLESLNGYLNFRKLGIIARQYWPDLYGETTSPLHRGSATDRLKAEWHLLSDRVRRREREPAAGAPELDAHPAVLRAVEREGVLWPGEPVLEMEDEAIRCEIPSSIQTVKAADPGAAIAWRAATRAVFQHYLDRGYVVHDCLRTPDDERRTVYLLDRRTSPEEPRNESE